MKSKTIKLSIFIFITSCLSMHAMFMPPQLAETPVKRLIENLEKRIKEKPKDVNLRYNLARTYAMAYAKKADALTALLYDKNGRGMYKRFGRGRRIPAKGQENKETKPEKGEAINGAWFGQSIGGGKSIAFNPVLKAKDEASKKQAEIYLQNAINEYKLIIAQDKNHLPSRLGHAWCLHQAGKVKEAKDEYRALLKLGWVKDDKRPSMRTRGIVTEGTKYLTELLTSKDEEAEKKALQERLKNAKNFPRMMTPVVIPMQDNMKANELLDRNTKVSFDLDGFGKREWSWISKDAAWLAYDQGNDRKIESGLELFGHVTLWLFWDNGYQAMELLDDNNDGVLSGAEFKNMGLWQDRNSNGVTDKGEFKTLSEAGVVELRYQYENIMLDGQSIPMAPKGVLFKDGKVRSSYDIFLHAEE